VWRSADLPETIFTRSFRLKQTDTTCWTIQIHSDKLNWARRRTFHELNSLSLFRLSKSLKFGLGLTKKNLILDIFTLQNFISLSLKWNYIILKTKFGALDAIGSSLCSLLLDCNKYSCPKDSHIKIQSIHNRITLGLTPTKLNHGEIQFKFFNIH